jgi:hypothetical protein
VNINTLRQKITAEEYGNDLVDRLIGKSQNIDNVDFGNEDILNMVISDFEKELSYIAFKVIELKHNESSPEDIEIDNYLGEIEEMLELELEELMDIIEIRLEELGYES